MKSTGIVRRIDDLGRVVVPKELRYKLGIREGDPLEIFCDDDMVCFKKYNVEGTLVAALNKVVDLINDEYVSDCLSSEEKEMIKSICDFVIGRHRESEDEND